MIDKCGGLHYLEAFTAAMVSFAIAVRYVLKLKQEVRMAFDFVSLIRIAVLAALSSNPTTAPIANEVADASVEAEQLFAPGQGLSHKLPHVLNIAKSAAQATDELRHLSADEVAGPVSQAVQSGIAAANAVIKAVGAFKQVPSSPV